MRTLPAGLTDHPARPAAAASPISRGPATGTNTAPMHHEDPVLARALLAAWNGDPAVVVASPPGAGKTRLVSFLADQLARRAGLRVAIAAQTRLQALDLTNRTAGVGGAPVALLDGKDARRPIGLDPAAGHCAGASGLRTRTGVMVATTARWKVTNPGQYRADVVIVDEAWQMTFADLGVLGALADQVVLVGDPGQIDPVVTGETARWRGWAAGPHVPAPAALLADRPADVTSLRLDRTWRLGPQTTALLQPVFYPFLPFTSARPDRHLSLAATDQPEIATRWLATAGGKGDPAIATAAAAEVTLMLSDGQVHDADGVRQLEPQDIAVVVPHVNQAAMIAAHLADTPGVLIGTANQCQGSEREAVVVIHPLAGYREAAQFGTDPGRLCVALSRHRTYATVLIDQDTPAVLARAAAEHPDDPGVAAHRAVLTQLARP